MTEKKRIACFFTGGYTELRGMKQFLKKINGNIEYLQLCPIGERKSKTNIKNRQARNICSAHSGLTGNALIQTVLNHIKTDRFKQEEYDAILIEDDKDDRFLEIQADGSSIINRDQWQAYQNEVKNKIHALYPNIPILFFFAAPEVEAWFLADWDNSFGQFYKDKLKEKTQCFSVTFRKHINQSILTDRYAQHIENYGYFDGKYKKLSSELQRSIETIDFSHCHIDESLLKYSKRQDGGLMLGGIDPKIVLRKCDCLFQEGFRTLQML